MEISTRLICQFALLSNGEQNGMRGFSPLLPSLSSTSIILPVFLLDASLPKSLQFQQQRSPLFPKALPIFHQNHISNSSNFEHDMPANELAEPVNLNIMKELAETVNLNIMKVKMSQKQ